MALLLLYVLVWSWCCWQRSTIPRSWAITRSQLTPESCCPLLQSTTLSPSSSVSVSVTSSPAGALLVVRMSPARIPREGLSSFMPFIFLFFWGVGGLSSDNSVLVRNIVRDQHDIIYYIISPVGVLCLYGHTYSKSMDQPGKVANPARGQLNRENEYFSLRVRAWEFDLARRVRRSRPASACPSPYSGWIWCLLTGFLPSSAAASIHLFKTAIRHRVSPEFIKVLARDRLTTDWISRTVP